jgi:K+-sensing histidine kinase KdpD
MQALISAGAITLLDAVADGITIQEPTGRLIYANPAAARAFGCNSPTERLAVPPAEIMARYEIFDEEGEPLPVSELPGRRALAGHPESERVMQFRMLPSTERRWSIVKAQPVHNEDGSVRFAVNIWHDITERVERQRQLEDASAELEETAAELEATVSELELRTEEAETRANRESFLAEAGRMLASSLDTESTLRMIVHLAVPKLAEWVDISLLDENDELQRLEIAHQDPDRLKFAHELAERFPRDRATDGGYRIVSTGVSELYPVITDELVRAGAKSEEHYQILKALDLHSAMAVPIKVKDRVLGVITFIRSSYQKPYNHEDLAFAESLAARSGLALENARLYREAQDASRAKSDFLAIMSHELRTPLTAIFGYTELLSTGVAGAVSPAQNAHLERIHASAAHLLTIIEDVLSYARTEAGRDQLRADAFSLATVVEEALVIVRPNAEKKGIEIHSQIRDNVDLRTDRAKVRQILINLLSNAIKFTDTGTISMCAEKRGPTLAVEVEDTGIGIATADFDRIFEPFRQLEPSMTRKAGGTGLGLAVSRRFAALLGGSLEVMSEVGKGSRFTLVLPLGDSA